jgi:hypothetical protein
MKPRIPEFALAASCFYRRVRGEGMLKIGMIVGSTRPNRKQEVNIGMEPYLGIVQKGAALNDYEYLVQSRKAMFDHLVWWGVALKAAREAVGARSV